MARYKSSEHLPAARANRYEKTNLWTGKPGGTRMGDQPLYGRPVSVLWQEQTDYQTTLLGPEWVLSLDQAA